MFCGPDSVELELLAHMIVHNTVNISRLKKYTADWLWEMAPPPPLQMIWDKDGTSQCWGTMEGITSHKRSPDVKGSYIFHIQWEGYDNEVSWEPAANLAKAKQMIADYQEHHRLGETKVQWKRKRKRCRVNTYWLHCVMESMTSRFIVFSSSISDLLAIMQCGQNGRVYIRCGSAEHMGLKGECAYWYNWVDQQENRDYSLRQRTDYCHFILLQLTSIIISHVLCNSESLCSWVCVCIC